MPMFDCPHGEKRFPNISSYFPLAADIILFFMPEKRVGMLGAVLIMVKAVLCLIWWGYSGYHYWLAVVGRWELSLMPEMLLKCPLLSYIFPPTNARFMASGGSHFSTQGQAGLSLLRAQRPPFNHLTKKEVAGACFWQYKRKQEAKTAPFFPFLPSNWEWSKHFGQIVLRKGKKLGNVIIDLTCYVGLLLCQPGACFQTPKNMQEIINHYLVIILIAYWICPVLYELH